MKYLKLLYESFKKSEYIKNITTLVVGSFFAQIITFIAIPFLSRIYLPEQFGAYSTFITLTGIIGLVSNLMYNKAVILPEDDKDAVSVFFISIGFTFMFFLLSIIAALFFFDIFDNWFLGGALLIFLFPLRVLQIGLFQAFEQISIRIKRYKANAYIRSSNSFITAALQLSNNFMYNLPGGLIIGKVFSDIIATCSFFFSSFDYFKKNIKEINIKRIIKNIKKFSMFPKYQLFSVLANTISQSMPILFLTSFFSLEVAGFYGMSRRVLKQPTELIGSSTQHVFYQTASNLFSKKESILPLFKDTTSGLIKIYILPLLIILFWGPQIFQTLLGDQWSIAGTISQVLIVWCFFTFIKPPSMVLFNILNLQYVQLLLEISQFILRMIALFIGYYFYQSYIIAIILYVVVSIFFDIFTIYYIYTSTLKYEKSIDHSPKKITFIISSLGQGGAERVLTTVANECVKQDISVEIISGYNNKSAYTIDKKIKVHRIGYRRLKSQNPFIILFPVIRRLYSITKILNKSKPHLIISFGDATNVQAIVANKFLRLNSSKHIISIRSNPEKLNFLGKVSINMFYKFSDMLITQSSFVQLWAKKKFRNLLIKQIKNPIRVFKNNLNNESIDFLHVGTIKEVKNHKSLIKAFSIVNKKSNQPLKLVLVGGVESNELFTSLKKLVKELNLERNVIFEGSQKNVNLYYQKTKIFVLPSFYEGTSNALLEAMSFGIACITTDYKGSRDVIHNNRTGVIVSLNDENDLADAMFHLYNNKTERQRIGKNATDFIIKNHDSNLIIKEWMDLIQGIFAVSKKEFKSVDRVDNKY